MANKVVSATNRQVDRVIKRAFDVGMNTKRVHRDRVILAKSGEVVLSAQFYDNLPNTMGKVTFSPTYFKVADFD